jgi:hypothetical protein
MGRQILWATASLGLALLSSAASAETFLDKVCKPGATWQMCYNNASNQAARAARMLPTTAAGGARGWRANETT